MFMDLVCFGLSWRYNHTLQDYCNRITHIPYDCFTDIGSDSDYPDVDEIKHTKTHLTVNCLQVDGEVL